MRSQYIAEESPCMFPRYQAQFWCLYFKEDEKMLEKIQIFCMSSASLEMGGLKSWTYSTSEKSERTQGIDNNSELFHSC